jgi:hypothetical protein
MSCCPPAGLYNITAKQGSTFKRTITWTNSKKQPIDLTSYSARMQVRSSADSATVVLELTTSNSRISLTGVTGQINLLVSATTMSSIPEGKYVYDLELVSGGGEVTTVVEGNFVVKAEVTR